MLGGRGVSHARGAFDDVCFELIRGVHDALRGLRARGRAVDSARGFRGVSTEEGAFIQKEHTPTVLEHGVRRAEAGEAAADDDNLLAHRGCEGKSQGRGARRCDRGRGELDAFITKSGEELSQHEPAREK